MNDLDEYYRILGLEPGASHEKVKQAYRDLVNVWHPDRFCHDPRLQRKAEENLREINDAYKRLGSFFQRSGYQPYQSQPPRDSAGSRFNKSQAPSKFPSRKRRPQEFVHKAEAMLIELESKLRAILAIVGIKLPPLTSGGRVKAALFFVAAIYLLVAAVFLLITL